MSRAEFSAAYAPYHGGAVDVSGTAWRALTACYVSHRLDAVCTGLGRHVAFAGWVAANEAKVVRLARRYDFLRNRKADAIRAEIARLQSVLNAL